MLKPVDRASQAKRISFFGTEDSKAGFQFALNHTFARSADVRFGSIASLWLCRGHFRLAPNPGQGDCNAFNGCPTGKSPKACPAPSAKIFLFFRNKNHAIYRAVLSRSEGRSRSSRTRGGMRWTPRVLLTRAHEADGEVVWSWRPDAGVKPVKQTFCRRGWQQSRSPGRARRKP
jgi:hypothetical protein